MRILFLHNNCPAQYRYLAPYLAAKPENDIVFATMNRRYKLANVRHVYYAPTRYSHPQTHHYLHNIENAVLHGQAVYRMARALKHDGFVPDIVCAHSGWGPPQFIKDVYPNAALLTYFEWYYNITDSDFGFLPDDPIDEDAKLRLRMKNTAINMDLIQCDHGICPTHWQHSQFPDVFKPKLTVLHDGVDTDFMQPTTAARLALPDCELTDQDEVITYVARGMEPYRGFPQFIQAVAQLQQTRPHCHVVIVGEDKVVYGRKCEEGQSYKKKALEEFPLDMKRTHFTALVNYTQLRNILQVSTVHVYLTVPFILSWSMLEAMACGCCVIGSDTPPVREIIQDGDNGLLTDFFSVPELVKRINYALDNRNKLKSIRDNARRGIVTNYAKHDLLPQHEALIMKVIGDHAN